MQYVPIIVSLNGLITKQWIADMRLRSQFVGWIYKFLMGFTYFLMSFHFDHLRVVLKNKTIEC